MDYASSSELFGRSDRSTLLTKSAHNALHRRHPWSWKIGLCNSQQRVAVPAIARKLRVSIWYVLHGLFTPLIDARRRPRDETPENRHRH